VSYQATGDGSAYYTVLSGHALFIAYYVNNCSCGGSGWDDYYNYQYFGEQPPDPNPLAYYNDFAPGPEQIDPVNDIILEETSASTAPCPIPINFRLDTSYGNAVTGDLYIKYLWNSSTGNQPDLSNVDIGELVNYPGTADPYTWPSPPWGTVNSQNPHPETYTGAGSNPGFTDTHYAKTFLKPYQAGGFTATQVYRYRTPCVNGGKWVIMTKGIQIVRSVTQNPDGTWQYKITADRQSYSLNLGSN
jgi:hypothetical protein